MTTAPNLLDRAAGVLLATACGDALGAGYEFDPPMADGAPVGMVGGGLGPFAPGEWTDDTAMAVAVARAAERGLDLRSAEGLDAVAAGFLEWFANEPLDVGTLTRAVLSRSSGADAAAMTAVAQRRYDEHPGSSGGNGGLMRTAAVALAHLGDEAATTEAARAVSALTHADPHSQEACALWSSAIRHAVRHASFDGLRLAVAALPEDRAAWWTERLDEAEAQPPSSFSNNGWVVGALQGAWSAITRTPVPPHAPGEGSFPALHLQHALEAAVRGGGDTDTVAAIAGGLLGARWGASAVPARWRREVFGWPKLSGQDLVTMGVRAAQRSLGQSSGPADWPVAAVQDYSGWSGTSSFAVHPHDDGVLLGGIEALRDLPKGVDAVVSLCRLGAAEWPAPGVAARDHVMTWLVDRGRGDNAHLELVIDDAARAVAQLRAEGRTVLLHCVAAQSRTPTVAARYSVIARGVDPPQALADVVAALPAASPNPVLVEALEALG